MTLISVAVSCLKMTRGTDAVCFLVGILWVLWPALLCLGPVFFLPDGASDHMMLELKLDPGTHLLHLMSMTVFDCCE